MEKYSIKINTKEKEDIIDDKLQEITLNCLRRIKSAFLVLQDSFITITNKDLVVLKCFISKNSNANITKFLPLVGTSLTEKSYGKTSILYASIKNETVQTSNNFKISKRDIKLGSSATPIKHKNQVVGYISLTTMNVELLKIINIFIESLSLNIERELEKTLIEKDLIGFLDSINVESNVKTINFLSAKELLVTKYMLMSYSNTEIANALYISESTVKTYLRRIYDKCGTSNRVDTAIAIICSKILQNL